MDENPSWQGGMAGVTGTVTGTGRHGDWKRKPRAHISNSKQQAENKVEVDRDVNAQGPSAVIYFIQYGDTS